MTGFKDGEFAYQYAIRGPDGRLLKHSIGKSFMKAMLGDGVVEDDDEPWPLVFDTLPEAELHLEGRKQQAAQLGVTDWAGVVVQRLCSPFTAHDAEAEFMTQLQAWWQEERPNE